MSTAIRHAADDLDPRGLARIRALVHGTAGIVVSDSKAGLVRARLARRLSATGCADIPAYLDYVEGPGRGEELTRLISVMTTNVTGFFREAHHFEVLAGEILPGWMSRPGPRTIWSAGCSTGQEAYSIAMTLREAGLDRSTVRVLATDIDLDVLARAASGSYVRKEVDSLPAEFLGRHFDKTEDGWTASRDLRRLVTFRTLNLVGDWPFSGRFDAVFCRNVAIYFDLATQVRLWRRICGVLNPGGHLFVGHSERLPEEVLEQGIGYLGRTIYAKAACPEEG